MSLEFPSDPLHQLLIHGFGAGVVILGATLFYASKKPHVYRMFILLDGLGRVLFSMILFYYVQKYSLMRTILFFGIMEFLLGVAYIWGFASSRRLEHA
jgi:hypothetical protein